MPVIDARTLLSLLERNPLAGTVESRCVQSFDYDLVTQTLTVSFPGVNGTGGRGTWEYLNFPLDEFVQFAGSFSLGQYFNLYIKDRYQTRRVA